MSVNYKNGIDLVAEYFRYKHRAEMLRRELRIANQMFRAAEDELRQSGAIPDDEWIEWKSGVDIY